MRNLVSQSFARLIASKKNVIELRTYPLPNGYYQFFIKLHFLHVFFFFLPVRIAVRLYFVKTDFILFSPLEIAVYQVDSFCITTGPKKGIDNKQVASLLLNRVFSACFIVKAIVMAVMAAMAVMAVIMNVMP